MRIREIIGDWLLTTKIIEEASERSFTRDKVKSLIPQIGMHLIKIIKWRDPTNVNKHARDIDNWITQIDQLTANGNNRPSDSDYQTWIYDYITPEIYNRWVKSLKKEYGKLPERNNDHDTYSAILFVLESIVKELQTDSFNTVEKYLQEII